MRADAGLRADASWQERSWTAAVNPVAQAIDGATGDWSMSGDAMRWSPDLAEQGPAAGELRGVELGRRARDRARPGHDRRPPAGVGALTSLGSVASDVVSELRQLTRGPATDRARTTPATQALIPGGRASGAAAL